MPLARACLSSEIEEHSMRYGIAVLAGVGLVVVASPGVADAPREAGSASAKAIGPLPARITGTLKAGPGAPCEPASRCPQTGEGVWYRFAPGFSRRVVARLVAAGT